MARFGNSFGRKKPHLEPTPTVLVICEDTKSGLTYVEDAASHFRVKVSVAVIHCGHTDPKGIVEEAVRRQAKFDRVFCVVDRDSHQGWAEALRLADQQKKVEVIASYPCFEYWLLLHFNDNRKPYVATGNKSPGDCCVADLKTLAPMSNYDKGKGQRIFNALLGRLADARKNAKRVYDDAIATDEMNPSTRLHELIGFFEELESEQMA